MDNREYPRNIFSKSIIRRMGTRSDGERIHRALRPAASR